MEAPQTRIPASRLLAWHCKKSSGAVTERGSFWMLLLEIRCSLCGLWREQAGSASAGGFSDEWSWAHNFSPVLPPLLLLEFPLGFSSCDKTSWTLLLLLTCIPQHCYWCWPSGSTQTVWKDQQVKDAKTNVLAVFGSGETHCAHF